MTYYIKSVKCTEEKIIQRKKIGSPGVGNGGESLNAT